MNTARKLNTHARTFPLKRLSQTARARAAAVWPRAAATSIVRPRTWGECASVGRGGPDHPCGYVGCVYHTALRVNPATGAIGIDAPFTIDPVDGLPDLDLTAAPFTCTLAGAAAAGARPEGLTLEDIGRCTAVTRERVRQIERKGLRRALAGILAHERTSEVGLADFLARCVPPGWAEGTGRRGMSSGGAR